MLCCEGQSPAGARRPSCSPRMRRGGSRRISPSGGVAETRLVFRRAERASNFATLHSGGGAYATSTHGSHIRHRSQHQTRIKERLTTTHPLVSVSIKLQHGRRAAVVCPKKERSAAAACETTSLAGSGKPICAPATRRGGLRRISPSSPTCCGSLDSVKKRWAVRAGPRKCFAPSHKRCSACR